MSSQIWNQRIEEENNKKKTLTVTQRRHDICTCIGVRGKGKGIEGEMRVWDGRKGEEDKSIIN